MNIKKLALFLLVVLTIGITACSSDSDSDSKGKYESSLFQGQWCAVEGPVAMILNLEKSSLTGEVFLNLNTTPTLYETLSGTWYYYSANNMMQLEMLHSSDGHQITTTYKVLKANSLLISMREQSTGAEDVFYRLVDSRTIDEGNSFVINYNGGTSFQAVSYASSNPSIASVDNTGKVTAKGQGVAFISAYSQQEEAVIIKVKVIGNVEHFVTELTSDIETITRTHGTPDVTGQSGQNQAILYRQPESHPSLSALQYQYDESTRKVTRILTLYKTSEGYKGDADYIKANYLDLGDNMYGLKEDFKDNAFLISPFVSDGQYYVSYNNTLYFWEKGHY